VAASRLGAAATDKGPLLGWIGEDDDVDLRPEGGLQRVGRQRLNWRALVCAQPLQRARPKSGLDAGDGCCHATLSDPRGRVPHPADARGGRPASRRRPARVARFVLVPLVDCPLGRTDRRVGRGSRRLAR
jgi:hypothetical protein